MSSLKKTSVKTARCLLSFVLVLAFFCSVPIGVHAKIAFSHGNREEKRIALTFDDGPHPRFTPKILELLDRYQIKATFFMIGCNVKEYADVAKQVQEKGHEIGNHTFSHPHMKEITPTTLEEELKKTEKVMEQHGITRSRLFRPPEGFRSAEQIALTESLGYQMIIWSLDPHDWRRGSRSDEMADFVLKHVQGGDILLFHDYVSGQNTTITALEQLIPKLLKDGYQFVTVSELMC